jgi:MFS transporter, ACS family, allantoate permease
MSWLIVWSL